MNIGERIKKLRRTLNLTQTVFASRIGSVQNTVTGYESGRRNPSAPVISLICREFNVNEDWLRTGEGEMFVETPEEDMFSRAAASCIKDNDVTAMEGLILWRNLPPEARRNVEEYILQLADLIKEHKTKEE